MQALHRDVQYEIYGYLSFKDFGRLAMTNKYQYSMIHKYLINIGFSGPLFKIIKYLQENHCVTCKQQLDLNSDLYLECIGCQDRYCPDCSEEKLNIFYGSDYDQKSMCKICSKNPRTCSVCGVKSKDEPLNKCDACNFHVCLSQKCSVSCYKSNKQYCSYCADICENCGQKIYVECEYICNCKH